MSVFYILNFIGCVTVPTREALPTYNLNSITYLPLITLCEQKGINWNYDTFTRTVTLTKDSHKINLMVGDNLVLVDDSPQHLKHPPQIYQGTVVVPYRFKEQILDVLFKEFYPQAKVIVPLLKIRKVAIDPGHGGSDPGTVGRTGLREKDVNLDITKRLSRLLNSYGIEVIMTRTTDRFVSLSSRVEKANNSQAELFISIHSNANRVRSLNGFEVYYVSPSVSDSKRAYATAESVALNLDAACFANNSFDLKAILWDMIYTHSRAQSIALACSICRSISNNLDTRIIGTKGGRFEVLRNVRMPAILIEVGFLSNYNEERMLKNSYYRQKLAESIAQGIRDYAKDAILIEMISKR